MIAETEHYVKDVLIVIPKKGQQAPVDLCYVIGIINSKTLRFYYRSTFKTIHVQREELSSLPLPAVDLKKPADKARHDEVIAKVKAMLKANKELAKSQTDKDKTYYKNKCSSLDRQIDRLVYDLYGLTKEEIEIVEGTETP